MKRPASYVKAIWMAGLTEIASRHGTSMASFIEEDDADLHQVLAYADEALDPADWKNIDADSMNRGSALLVSKIYGVSYGEVMSDIVDTVNTMLVTLLDSKLDTVRALEGLWFDSYGEDDTDEA